MKTYLIPEFGVTVTVLNGAGTIESKLKEHLIGDTPTPNDFELIGAVDALEALILAHACAGIDVAAPAYVQGLRSSLEAIANHYLL
jgi:hypothetical protein